MIRELYSSSKSGIRYSYEFQDFLFFLAQLQLEDFILFMFDWFILTGSGSGSGSDRSEDREESSELYSLDNDGYVL